MNKLFRLAGLVSVATVALVAQVGCAAHSEDEVLEPNVAVIDRTTQALSTGDLLWLDGTYGTGCKDPATGAAHLASDAWSLRISGSDPMTNDALAVTKGDSDCVLTLTHVKTVSNRFAASSTLALAESYAASARSFGSGADLFYANAKISPADMSANPTVTFLFSDQLSAVDGGTKTGSYAQFAGSAGGEEVAAPDYSLNVNNIAVEANDDHTVSSTTGQFKLTDGSVPGGHYRIHLGEITTPSYDEVDAVYNAASSDPAAVEISGAVEIASGDILANGTALPAKRTVIIRRVVSGVASYQIFTLSFDAPSTPI